MMKAMDTKTPGQLAAIKAIRILGGPVSAARLLNVKDHRYQTVQSWARHRVPAEYCPLIEHETALRGERVACDELRDDVAWALIREAPVNADQSEG